MHPHLGIVSLPGQRRFVIADIPGLLPGAAMGRGLGIQFLKHLSRTTLLLHLVDLIPFDGVDPVDSIRAIENELMAFSEDLAAKPRWLVFNKMDCYPIDEANALIERITQELGYEGPVFAISALTKQGVDQLCEKTMQFMQVHRQAHSEACQADELISAYEHEEVQEA